MAEQRKKANIVAELQAVKLNSGKTYNQIAEETGLTNVFVAQLLKRQAQLKPETAPKLKAALPGLPEEVVQEMMLPPLRSYDPNLIQEPTVYRWPFYPIFLIPGVFMCFQFLLVLDYLFNLCEFVVC